MAVSAWAHLDAPRVPLSRLFLEADFVAIARIDTVEDRIFEDGDKQSKYEVVTATISDSYKGEPLQVVEFFQYAHGHAWFQPGQSAVLFLEKLAGDHQLSRIGKAGGIHYVSHQVRNTEHRLNPSDVADYQWVLAAYAASIPGNASSTVEPSRKLQEIMLRMLRSDSSRIAESALLDWSTAGNGISFNEEEVVQLSGLARDPGRPMSFRLALLRELSNRNLAGPEDWAYLLGNESEENLLLLLRSMDSYENRELLKPLVALLGHPSDFVAEGAARALGHPVYAGVEPSLKHLLASENQRLNYAAVDGLVGIASPEARLMLSEAANNHPNARVRRKIAVGLKPAGTATN
jgi:hypothetical protein